MNARFGSLVAGSVFLVLGCGSGASPGPTMADSGSEARADAAPADSMQDEHIDLDRGDAANDVCVPVCEGRVCGPDGCSGDCGSCSPDETCDESGQCVTAVCQSSKDCPGDLVCAVDEGVCVACVGDEDCPPDRTCGADHECHATYPCKSDKDCKEYGLVCDKAAGQCVECLAADDCPGVEFCKDAFCVADVCSGSEAACDGQDIVVCAADGSGYEVAASCSGQQYCEDGECLGYACIAGNIWCEGEVYKVCSGDGKSVQYEEDCASSGKHCLQSGCNENVCDPGVKFCADEVTAATCFDDGTNYSTLDCGVGQFCLSGACLAWVCEPNLSWCDGSQVVTCNQWGSGYLPPAADCAASNECCVGGTCVPKAVETCDGADNDCDGEVDEGVLSACGDCDPDCGKIGLGPGSDNPFKTVGPGVFQMEPDAQGNLVVLSGAPKLKHLWVANSGEGTVTKLDTELGVEVARYKVCGDPSRTAVDLHGNVWVACRGDGGVAKIAGHPAFCVDKNGNGTVDTVQDSNGNGKFDPGEMLPSGDECVMFTTFPGGSCQRAIGVDRDNFAWVGEWSGGMLRRLSPTDGAVVDVVDIPGNPYGLVVDGAGVVWVSGRGGDILVRVDPNQNPLSVSSWGVPGGNLYGITVDLSGKVWIGQYSNGTAARFDPNTKQFNTVNIGGCPRGMAASVDGFIYSGLGCSGNEIAKINAATFQVEKLSTGQGQTPIGVALDWDGFVWAVCYSTSNAAKIDPATKQTFGPFAVGSYPYTYSDMTGYVLHHFTSPSGPRFYSDVVVAPEGVPVVWTSFAQGVVTEGAGCPEAVVTLRAGNGLAELAQQNWLTPVAQDPGQPYVFDLGGLQLVSSHFEFRVEVPSPPAGCTVKLTGVTIQYQE